MTGSIARASSVRTDRASDLPLVLDRSSGEALHRQLVAGLRDAIAAGRIRPGTSVPGSRSLARELGVARITIQTAYDQLVALDGQYGNQQIKPAGRQSAAHQRQQ